MDEPESWDVLIDELRGNRAELLLAINDNYPAETPKSEITDTVKSVNYHLDILDDWGLIEVVAHEQQGDRIPARVFSLTDRGRDAVEDLFEQTGARPIPSAVEQHIESLRSDVEDARADAREAREEAREAQGRVDNLKDWIKANVADTQGAGK
jgi:DNA-binding PadR family transcriptional regulator